MPLLGWIALLSAASGQTAVPQGSTPAETLNQYDDPVVRRTVSLAGNYSVTEILDFMKSFSVNFVVPARMDLDTFRLRLNIQDKPLRDIMVCVSTAMNGTWIYQAGIYILRLPGTDVVRTAIPAPKSPNLNAILPKLSDDEFTRLREAAEQMKAKPPTPKPAPAPKVAPKVAPKKATTKKPTTRKPTVRRTSSKRKRSSSRR
jgi:hypothetical protein